MGIVTHDGGRRISSGAPTYQPPRQPKTFQEALDNAHTASTKALASHDSEQVAAADMSWTIVQDMEEDEYRVAATSDDPEAAIAALDAKYARMFRGNGAETEIFDRISADAKKTVQDETPAEQDYNLKLDQAQDKVTAAYDKLQSASTDDDGKAFTAYTAAVKELINLELGHELAKLPAGAKGSHTLDQWQQAADTVKKQSGATGGSADIIDKIAKVSGYLDQIENNRTSLNLTDAEEDLAEKDPAALAFVKAAGVTLNPDDPKLSAEMQDIARQDPVLFTLLQLSGAKVWTAKTPMVKDTVIGQLPNGEYIHLKVNGQPFPNQKLLNEMVQLYKQTESDYRSVALGGALLPHLNLDKNTGVQSLMLASDNARTQYAAGQFKALTSGDNPDIKAAASFMNTQLNGFFDSGAREVFWNDSGKPYFTKDLFRKRFDKLTEKPDATSTDVEDIRALASTETNADIIGRDAQDFLKDCPKEIAGVYLDSVKSEFNKDWYKSNQYDSTGATSRFEDFYKSLSMAIELNPERAGEFSDWLMDRSGVQGGVLPQLWDPNLHRFEGVKDTIQEGYGPTLSKTLLEKVNANSDFQNMQFDLDMRVNQGWSKIQGKYAETIAKQDYTEFMKDKDKALQPFFQSFLKDKNIGNPVKIESDTQLHNMVGKTFGYVPDNTKAAADLDYTTEWYEPGTPEWNTILLVTQMIRDRGADTVNALPFKYLSKLGGMQTGGLFIITKPGSDEQEVIDGNAAADAVAMQGGAPVKSNSVDSKWLYDNFKEFQDGNAYDDSGYIYLPKDFRLNDSDHDGQIEPEDYEEHRAAITTGGERASQIGMTVAAIGGSVLLFVPGAQVIGAGILVGTGVFGVAASGYELWRMYDGKANIGWGNAQARAHYLNIAGNLLAFGRLGILTKWTGKTSNFAKFMKGTGALAGGVSTYIGFSQITMQTQTLVQNWSNPEFDWIDKATSVAGVVSGATMMGLSGMKVKPARAMDTRGKDYGVLRVVSARLTGSKAFQLWKLNQSKAGGLVADLWTNAKTTLETSVGKPAYEAWVKANRPPEQSWTDARAAFDPRIVTKAQDIAGAGKSVTQTHRDQAEAFYGEQIALDAFGRWGSAGGPKGVTSKLWSKAQKEFDTQTTRTAYQVWRAEKAFIKQIGKPAYDAHIKSVKAGNPPEAWWTTAIADFRAKFRTEIDARAKYYWNKDTDAAKPNWNDARYIAKAEAEFGGQIGLEAYKLWNTVHGRQQAPLTLTASGKKSPSTYTYRGWVHDDKPARLTTKGDDVVLWADTQRVLRLPWVAKPLANALLPSRLTQAQIDGLGPWRDGRPTVTPLATLSKWTTFTRGGIVRGTRLKAAQIVSGERNLLQQSPTATKIWTGAENAFRIRIGKTNYQRWDAGLNKPLGQEDTYFQDASTFYKNQIAAKAYEYFDGTKPLPGFLRWTTKKGATTEFWSRNRAEFETQLKQSGEQWVRDGMPRTLRHWKEALKDMDPQIQSKAYDLWQEAGGPASGKTKAHFIPDARKALSYDIAQNAFVRWTGTSSPSAKYAAPWQAANKADKANGVDAYDKWAEAGHPDGWRNVPWVQARRAVGKPASFAEWRQQRGDAVGQWGKDLRQETWIKARERGGLFNTIGARQFGAQTWSTTKAFAKWYTIPYAVTNALGMVGWLAANKLVHETRTSGDIADAQDELRKLMDNPETYVDDNYKNEIFGITLSDDLYQADGHLLAYVSPEGEIEYFRRIPKDLYEALKAKAQPGGAAPWALDAQANQQGKPQIFEQGGTLYVYETINLAESGDFVLTDADPLKTDPEVLPEQIKEQIGVRAYEQWVLAGRPKGMAAAGLWEQAEKDFLPGIGTPAYNAWVKAGRPKTDLNVYWDQAVAGFQTKIDDEAKRLAGNNRAGPTQLQKDDAEAKFGDQIAVKAYELWKADGRKIASGGATPTAGVAIWKQAEPAFQKKIGTPAFEAWVAANRSTDADNRYWQAAIAQWDAAKKPIMQKVDIRAPYRVEGNVDGDDIHSSDKGAGGRRDRWILAAGPIEGWRMHGNLELDLNYRYNTPTATTFRIGGPSPTQGWSWDVRQQDTTLWHRINIGLGSIEFNGAQVYDLSDNSQEGFSVMNSRLYLDIGNRNRVRLDATGKYLRFRDTGFVELGLGSDFFKYTSGSKTLNVNGYYELQFYAPDFRAQINMKKGPANNPGWANARGLEPFPLLGIDPAFQVTWSDSRIRAVDLAYVSGERR